LLDDVFGLKPWMKILGQVPAAAVACYAGVQIHGIGGHSIAGAWRCIPLTMFWLVGCANAFNLIDGLDGLAVLPQLRWLRNFFEPVLRLPNPADKRAVFCFHHAVAAAGFQHSEKPM